ncbi:MAG: hypothetical protein CV087_10465, partial [Candidatus Brocadia sp. WS118]
MKDKTKQTRKGLIDRQKQGVQVDALVIRLGAVPISLNEANNFVEAFHRHNGRTARNGGKFAIGAVLGDDLVGVAIVGNPLSATLMDGFTAEVL